jgi:DNA-binding transcriptional MocR family regulator
MRLGWLLAPDEIAEKCELAKQSMDACSSSFTQVLAYSYLEGNHLPAYLDHIREVYRRRAGTMLEALESHMPAGVTWTRPKGGFYVWVTLPRGVDSSEVFTASIKRGAAFVIGSAFDPGGTQNDCFRLAFPKVTRRPHPT